MADMQNLYQQAILDHYRKPRNFGKPQFANRQAEEFNPFCGDKINIFLQIEDGIVHEIGFTGEGCAISVASASMMTEILKGKSEAEANILFERFCQLFTHHAEDPSDQSSLGILDVFSSVRGYPVRVKCATLAWHAMRTALKNLQKPATTE